MMESGHLTMEESEIELRDLELRESKNNKTPIQQIPEKKQEKHATIVPSMCQKNMQGSKQSAHGGNERTAPKCNNDEKDNLTLKNKPLTGNNRRKTDIDTKGDINKSSDGPDKFVEGDARSNSEQWTPKKIRNNNNAKHIIFTLKKNNNNENIKERQINPGRNVD